MPPETSVSDDVRAYRAALVADRDKLEQDAIDLVEWAKRARHIDTKAALVHEAIKARRAVRAKSIEILLQDGRKLIRAVA